MKPESEDQCLVVDELAKRARKALDGAAGPIDTLDRLNRVFFQTERFQVTYDLSSADHLLPGRVIAGKNEERELHLRGRL